MLHSITGVKPRRGSWAAIVGLLYSLCIVSAAHGQEPSSTNAVLDSTYFVSVGLFAPDRKVRLGLDASFDIIVPQPIVNVDFAETLNLKSTDETFSAEFGWNFGKRWQFRGQYFRIDSNQQAVLTEDVQWGDYVFDAGTSVGAGTDMQITRLFFGRRFWGAASTEAGLGIGAHLLNLSGFINGNASINGEAAGFVRERASVSQPLPNVGGWIRHAWSERWLVRARLDWLAASVGKYDGHIINASLGILYAMNDHFGLSLSHNLFEIDLGVDDQNWHGNIRSRFQGPYLALTVYW